MMEVKAQPKVEVTTYHKAPMNKAEIAGSLLFVSLVGIGALIILGGALTRFNVKPFSQWSAKIADGLKIGNGAIEFGAIAAGISVFGIGTFGLVQIQHNRSIVVPPKEKEEGVKKSIKANDEESEDEKLSSSIPNSGDLELVSENSLEEKKDEANVEQELPPPIIDNAPHMMSLKDRITLSKKHTAGAVMLWTLALASFATLLLAFVPKTPLGNFVRKYPGAWVPLWVVSTFSTLAATALTCHTLRPRIASPVSAHQIKGGDDE